MKIRLLILFFTVVSFSQTRTVSVDFKPVMNGQLFRASGEGENAVSVCKFYISGVKFLLKGKPVCETQSYFLIDFFESDSWHREVSVPTDCRFDQIQFDLGIDAATNEKGIGDGDLDPIHGMYWAWQSGYINVKLEGIFSGKPFEYHLGGFQNPYLACRTITLSASEDKISIFVDPFRFLQNIPDGLTRVMSPGENAMKLSDIAVNMFYR